MNAPATGMPVSPAPSLIDETAEESRWSVWTIATLSALALAHLPLLLAYAAELWELPHYQFFPIVFAGAFLLARQGVRGLGQLQAGQAAWFLFLIGLVLTMLAVSILFYSPWLSAVSAMLSIAAVAYGLGGSALLRRLLPAWVLLLLVIRLPMSLDFTLISGLQAITAFWASVVLDLVGVVHTLSGNVVELPNRRLLVEEACSGIHSLFSALACTVFYVLWVRRRPIPSILLIFCCIGAVLVANVLRVVAVAILRSRWGIAADEGMLHETLGVAIFVLAMLVILSTDRLLLFFTPGAVAEDATGAPQGESLEVAPIEPAATRLPDMATTWFAFRPLLIICCLLLLIQVPQALRSAQETAIAGGATELPALGAEAMPQQWGPWQCTNFKTEQRDLLSDLGEFSQSWSFQTGNMSAIASLDYPFSGWHELTTCYRDQGWVIHDRTVHEGRINMAGEPGQMVEVDLRKEDQGLYGYLLFELFDKQGRPVPAMQRGEIDELIWRVTDRLESWSSLLGGKVAADARRTRNSYQLQLFLQTYVPLSSGEEQQMQDFFRELQQRLRERWSALNKET